MKLYNYILDASGNPVVEKDLFKWAEWCESNSRLVAHDKIDGVEVSTIFLAIDHNFMGEYDSPALWETKVFGGKMDGEIKRCSGSIEQAEAMHSEMIKAVSS